MSCEDHLDFLQRQHQKKVEAAEDARPVSFHVGQKGGDWIMNVVADFTKQETSWDLSWELKGNRWRMITTVKDAHVLLNLLASNIGYLKGPGLGSANAAMSRIETALTNIRLGRED